MLPIPSRYSQYRIRLLRTELSSRSKDVRWAESCSQCIGDNPDCDGVASTRHTHKSKRNVVDNHPCNYPTFTWQMSLIHVWRLKTTAAYCWAWLDEAMLGAGTFSIGDFVRPHADVNWVAVPAFFILLQFDYIAQSWFSLLDWHMRLIVASNITRFQWQLPASQPAINRAFSEFPWIIWRHLSKLSGGQLSTDK